MYNYQIITYLFFKFTKLKININNVEKIFLITIQFATNVQLKYLTHKFYRWISSHKLL
jgi:hypothetical protein